MSKPKRREDEDIRVRRRESTKQSYATITITKALANTATNVYTSTTKTLPYLNSLRSTNKVDLKTHAFYKMLLDALMTFQKDSHNCRITIKLKSAFTFKLMVIAIMTMNLILCMNKFRN